MQIRFTEEHELPELLNMLKSKAEFDGYSEFFTASDLDLKKALFSESPLAYTLVAIIDNKIVGTAIYYYTFSSFTAKQCLWLDDIYVNESLRSMGTGKALMKRIIEIAKENNCSRLNWTVAESNIRARKFYRNLGAIISEKEQLATLNIAGSS